MIRPFSFSICVCAPQEQLADAQAQRVHGARHVTAQLERDFFGTAVPGGEPGHENVHDGAVHVSVQLDAIVLARVHCPTTGRGGVLLCPVRGHAQPARVRVPERRVPQGNPARGVQPQTAPGVVGQGGRSGVPTAPAHDGPSSGQRVRAEFPHVVHRVPALIRQFHHAAARRLCRHVQSGKTKPTQP